MPLNNSQDESYRTASPFEKGGSRGILRVSNPPYPPFAKGGVRFLNIVKRHKTQ